jgi:hypothetical protein
MTPTDRFRVSIRVSLVALAALAVVAGGYVIATTVPTRDSFYPKCVTHQLTSLHCPGCGTGRAAHFVLTGRPLDAARANLFAPFLLPFAIVAAFRGLLRWALDSPPSNREPVRAIWLWLLVAGLLVYTVARNIPVQPFTSLAPQEISPIDATP